MAGFSGSLADLFKKPPPEEPDYDLAAAKQNLDALERLAEQERTRGAREENTRRIASIAEEAMKTLDDPRYKDVKIVDTTPSEMRGYAAAKEMAAPLRQKMTSDIQGDIDEMGLGKTPPVPGDGKFGAKAALGLMIRKAVSPLDVAVPEKRPVVAETLDEADRAIFETVSKLDPGTVDALLPPGSNERELFGRLSTFATPALHGAKAVAGTRAGVTVAAKTAPLTNRLIAAGKRADDAVAAVARPVGRATGRAAGKVGDRLKDAVKVPPGMSERGAAINPAPHVLKAGKRGVEVYGKARDYMRDVWKDKVFGTLIEDWVWGKFPELGSRALNLDVSPMKQIKAGKDPVSQLTRIALTAPHAMRDAAKYGFGTVTVRGGEEYAMRLRDILAQPRIAQIDAEEFGKHFDKLTPDEMREATRYMAPRVAGAKPVVPAWATDDQIAVMEAMKATIRKATEDGIAIGSFAPDTPVEDYLYRRFAADPDFGRSDTYTKSLGLDDIYYKKNAPGAVVELSPDEARTLMKGVGQEGLPLDQQMAPKAKAVEEWWGGQTASAQKKIIPRRDPKDPNRGSRLWEHLDDSERAAITQEWDSLGGGGTEGIIGEAELQAIRVAGKGKRTVVKFGLDKYADEAAAGAARDEFLKRYRRAYGKSAKVHDKFEALSEDALAAMDELVNVEENVHHTLARINTRNSKMKLFQQIADDPKMVGSADDPAFATGKDMPNTWRWGPLKGKRVRWDIHKDLQSVDKTLNTSFRVWRAMLSKWKAFMTISNPRTHSRNFLGAGFFNAMGDVAPPWYGGMGNFPTYWKGLKALKPGGVKLGTIKGARPEYAELDAFREALKRGVVGTEYSAVELSPISDFMRRAENLTPEQLGGEVVEFFNRPWTGKHIGGNAAKLYGVEDAWHKLTMFLDQIKKGNTLDGAAKHVHLFTQNYNELGPAVKMWRQSPAGGPFASFTAEAARIMYNGFKHRPVKTAGLMLLMQEGIPNIARATTGMTDEEWAAVRERGPLAVPLPFRTKNGNIETIAMDYIVPYGALADPIWQTEYNKDEDVRKWVGGIPAWQNPAITLPMGFVTGVDPYSGRPVWRYGEKKWGVKGAARHAAEQLLPGLAPGGREFNKVIDMVKGRPFHSGEPRGAARTIVDVLFGLNPRPMDPYIEASKYERKVTRLEREQGMQEGYFERMARKPWYGHPKSDKREFRPYYTEEEKEGKQEDVLGVFTPQILDAEIALTRLQIVKAQRQKRTAWAGRLERTMKVLESMRGKDIPNGVWQNYRKARIELEKEGRGE